MDLQAGAPVRLEMTKWGGRPHWAFAAAYLGADEHGDWIGIVPGTHMTRPGAEVWASVPQVGLVPHGVGWLATFHAPGYVVTTYVDMTTVPSWDLAGPAPVCRAVNLDLDVVRTAEGRVFVDDEDEFAAHRVDLGYPEEVVSLAESSCAWVLAAVQHSRPPFDATTSDHWLDHLDRLGLPAGPPAGPDG